ncbi:MAG: glycosyltransferase [Idiomarina sp.]|nr:glycosyltransferase [Idiomarina sp.]
MRILYGVQGTGNGHVTRALAMAEAFKQHPDIEVQFLISGRSRDTLFGVEALGDFIWREGLSFAIRNGKVSVLDTLSHNPWWGFWRDVHQLDLADYDLVLTDFEPVTAWAAKRQQVPCIGLGRQYAFVKEHHSLPASSLQRAMIKQFAPCDRPLGTHWQPLDDHTLPPIIETQQFTGTTQTNRYLVYLPFQPLADIERLLSQIAAAAPQYQFDVFHPQAVNKVTANATFFMPSRTTFKHAFDKAEGVISNAGFGTSSEALSAGKKLLVKPLTGQFEQWANAHCLDAMELGSVSLHLDFRDVMSWLKSEGSVQLQWPNVAGALAQWIAAGARTPVHALTASLWQVSQLQRHTA